MTTRIAIFHAPVAKMYISNWSNDETMMREKFGKDLPPIVFIRRRIETARSNPQLDEEMALSSLHSSHNLRQSR